MFSDKTSEWVKEEKQIKGLRLELQAWLFKSHKKLCCFPLPIPQILLKHKTVALIPSQRNHLMLRLGIPSPIKTLFVFLATKNT